MEIWNQGKIIFLRLEWSILHWYNLGAFLVFDVVEISQCLDFILF